MAQKDFVKKQSKEWNMLNDFSKQVRTVFLPYDIINDMNIIQSVKDKFQHLKCFNQYKVYNVLKIKGFEVVGQD